MELTLESCHTAEQSGVVGGSQTLDLFTMNSLPQRGCQCLHRRSEHNLTSHAIWVPGSRNGASPPSPLQGVIPQGRKLSCGPLTSSLGTPLLHAVKSILRLLC